MGGCELLDVDRAVGYRQSCWMWTELLDVDRAHSEVRGQCSAQVTLRKTSYLLHIHLFLEHASELNVKVILFSLSELF